MDTMFFAAVSTLLRAEHHR